MPVEAVIAYIGDPATDKVPAEAPARPKPAKAAGEQAGQVVRPSAAASAEPPAAETAAPVRLLISPRARKLAEAEKVTPLAVRGSGPGGRIVEADVAAYAKKVAALRVSPTAKVVAYQRGVDLLSVRGTGPGGRIMKQDVEKASPLRVAPAAKVELTAMRRIVADRMSRSKREAPHFYLQMDIDMTEAVALRERLKAAGVQVSYNDLIIKAVAAGFAAVPMMNASWAGDSIEVHATVDVALAVSIEGGLMVPVVRGVERLSLVEVAARTAELIEKARTKRLTPFEYEGGSITVSNLGMFGVDNFLPIINPGQGSILGVGAIADKVVVCNGGIAIRKRMAVTLSVDHRVADGAVAAAFFLAFRNALESPAGTLV